MTESKPLGENQTASPVDIKGKFKAHFDTGKTADWFDMYKAAVMSQDFLAKPNELSGAAQLYLRNIRQITTAAGVGIGDVIPISRPAPNDPESDSWLNILATYVGYSDDGQGHTVEEHLDAMIRRLQQDPTTLPKYSFHALGLMCYLQEKIIEHSTVAEFCKSEQGKPVLESFIDNLDEAFKVLNADPRTISWPSN